MHADVAVPTVSSRPEKPIEVCKEAWTTSRQPSWENLDMNGSSADLAAKPPTGTSQVTVNPTLNNKNLDTRFTMSFKPGSFGYVSPQKRDFIRNIICRIYANAELISENTATGAHYIDPYKHTE